jgi:imidazolonepropionase-like amidohydrolase
VHHELETFVQAGLTPYAALETATRNPAAYLGVLNRKGTIEEGKEATLILLGKNPLDDIRNSRQIKGIFTGNNFYDRAALDQMEEQAKAAGN